MNNNLPPGVTNADIERAAGVDDDLAFTRPTKVKVAPRLTAPDFLEAGARTYRQRNKHYGDNYHHFGVIMMGMFPQGLPAGMTAADWNRLTLLMQVVGKAQRYAMNLGRGGHVDSAHDAMVYAAMLEELTDEQPL